MLINSAMLISAALASSAVTPSAAAESRCACVWCMSVWVCMCVVSGWVGRHESVLAWEAEAYQPALADIAQAGLTGQLIILGSGSPQLSAKLLDLLSQPLRLIGGLHITAATWLALWDSFTISSHYLIKRYLMK